MLRASAHTCAAPATQTFFSPLSPAPTPRAWTPRAALSQPPPSPWLLQSARFRSLFRILSCTIPPTQSARPPSAFRKESLPASRRTPSVSPRTCAVLPVIIFFLLLLPLPPFVFSAEKLSHPRSDYSRRNRVRRFLVLSLSLLCQAIITYTFLACLLNSPQQRRRNAAPRARGRTLFSSPLLSSPPSFPRKRSGAACAALAPHS
mmetsp:Transcript_2802/g.7712  ORF Transcript_2802/g.7712 Transcript_2802/m.7712 type:complete len:204 (+) Transcript_2802:673-1284(+)